MSCFFSSGFGSSFFSVTFGGSGFFSTGFSSALGCGGGAVSVTTGGFFSSFLPTASSMGFASATFSTSGFFSSFLPVFMPAATWDSSEMSTPTDSSSLTSSALVENDSITQPSTSTCRATDASTVLSTLTFTSRSLLGNDHDIGLEPRGLDVPQHLHHVSVADILVAAQKDHVIRFRPRLADRLDLGQQFGVRNLGVAEIQLHIGIAAAATSLDRQGQRRGVGRRRVAALGYRQVDVDRARHQRRCHHENDEQNQHHVHHGRDVDLGHHGLAPPAVAAAARGASRAHAHMVLTAVATI